MAVERIIGIDFGTSSSVIRVKRYQNGKPVGDPLETKEVAFGDGGAVVPTLILKKDDDPSVVYYGYEAQQKKRRFTTFSNFKMDLESTSKEKQAQARAHTKEFLRYMAEQYRRQSDGGHLGSQDDMERTIVSYPVKWKKATKDFLLSAATQAGFPNVTGMDEAQAAIHAVITQSEDHLKRQGLLENGTPVNILLIDMGAGTTDLVLCRHTPGDVAGTEILTTWPKGGEILFGGKDVDNLLRKFFWDQLDEADAKTVLQRVSTDKFKSWKEMSVSPALRNNHTVTDFEALDSCVEMLGIDMGEYCLDRKTLESYLEDYLRQFPKLINGGIYAAGLRGSDVDLVIVTGGHSQWYFVQEMLSGKMSGYGNIDLPLIKNDPERIISISRPQETVALGLVYSPMHPAIPVCREVSVIDRNGKEIKIRNPGRKTDIPKRPQDIDTDVYRHSEHNNTESKKQKGFGGIAVAGLAVLVLLFASLWVAEILGRDSQPVPAVNTEPVYLGAAHMVEPTQKAAAPENNETVLPGTLPPAAVSPTMEPSVTEPPVTEMSVTEPPITEPPATEPWMNNVLRADFNVNEDKFDWSKLPDKYERNAVKKIGHPLKRPRHVIFYDNLKGLQDVKYSRDEYYWDVSEAQDGSVMAWYISGHPSGEHFDHSTYECSDVLCIGAEGGINASLACERMFADCESLKYITFNGSLHTTGATSMKEMFYNCTSLKELDVTGLDTSSVTDMSSMFYGLNGECELIVDWDTFDTSQVEKYDQFYYYGENLNGKAWTELFEN